jgi:hypothetical protein
MRCVMRRGVLPLPPGFDVDDAAAFAFTYGTSHHALMDRAALQAGETVLVLGAAGGVGTRRSPDRQGRRRARDRRRLQRRQVRLLPRARRR